MPLAVRHYMYTAIVYDTFRIQYKNREVALNDPRWGVALSSSNPSNPGNPVNSQQYYNQAAI